MNSKLIAFDLGNSLKLDGTYAPGPNGAVPLGATVGNTYGSVATFLNLLVPIVFILAGVILLFLLIGGGFSIVASGGNAKNVENGKNQIMSAVIGFLIIFAAYWIIQIVEKFTGVPILSGSGL